MKELPLLLQQLIRKERLKQYPKGQIIFYQGDHHHEVAILSQGYVRVYDIDDQGNEKILHILKPGSILPFSFFSGEPETINWFYAALTDCDIYVLNKDKLEQALKNNPELTMLLMHWLSLEVHELLVRLSSMGKSNAKIKIMAALMFLTVHSSKLRPSGWQRVVFPVNHQLLADMTGVTRESAALIMKDLAQNGLVRNPRQTILEIKKEKFS